MIKMRSETNLTIKDKKTYTETLNKAKYFVFLFLFISFCISVVIAASAILKSGYVSFISALASFNPQYFLAAVFVVFLSFNIRFPKWYMFIKRLGVKVSLFRNYMVYLSLYSMNVTPGRSGRLVASYTLNKVANAPVGRTAPAVVADLFTDFMGYMIVTVSAALIVGQYLIVSIIASALLLLPFIILFNDSLFKYVKFRIGKGGKRFKRFFDFGDAYFENTKLINKRTYIKALVFAVPSELMSGLALYFIIMGFGVHVMISPLDFIPLVIFIYSSSVLFGIISGIPGTIGVTELGILGYLTLLLQISYPVAAAITILFGLSNLWFTEFAGFGALAYTARYWK